MQDNQKKYTPEKLFEIEEGEKSYSQVEEIGTIHATVENTGEAIETIQFNESGNERVSERVHEGKEIKGDAKRSTTRSSKGTEESIAAVKERLLERLPRERVMKREIKSTVDNEIQSLFKNAKKAERSGNIFLLNNIVAKIRELKNLLANLAYITYEALKNLWLKIVHGIEY
jgi:hypothetical protein